MQVQFPAEYEKRMRAQLGQEYEDYVCCFKDPSLCNFIKILYIVQDIRNNIRLYLERVLRIHDFIPHGRHFLIQDNNCFRRIMQPLPQPRSRQYQVYLRRPRKREFCWMISRGRSRILRGCALHPVSWSAFLPPRVPADTKTPATGLCSAQDPPPARLCPVLYWLYNKVRMAVKK